VEFVVTIQSAALREKNLQQAAKLRSAVTIIFLTTPTPSEGGEFNSPPSEGVGVVKNTTE
jgi:hypothetical protein